MEFRVRVVVASAGAAGAWWGGRGLVAGLPVRRRLCHLLEWLGGLPAPVLLRRMDLDPTLCRAVVLNATPWLCALASGNPERTPQLVAGIRLLGVGAALPAAAGAFALTGPAGAAVALVVAPAASVCLDLRVALSTRTAQRRLAEQLPLAVELLAICLAGGLSLEHGLSACAAEVEVPLRNVLATTGVRISTGAGAGEALREEADRTAVPGLDRVAAVLERRGTLGLPQVAPLHALAEELRTGWRATLLARVGRATPLAALVTALVVAPACVVGLAVCLVGAVMAQGVVG